MNLHLHLPTPNSQNTNQSPNPNPVKSENLTLRLPFSETGTYNIEVYYEKGYGIKTTKILKGNVNRDYWECKDYDENGSIIKEYITHLPELPRIECPYIPPTPNPQKPPNPRPYKTPLDT